MKNKNGIAAFFAVVLATSAFASTGVFNFETSSQTPISTQTGDAVGWSDYQTPGSVYATTSTASHGGYLTVSGEYTGGVISNSTTNTGTTYTGDVDSQDRNDRNHHEEFYQGKNPFLRPPVFVFSLHHSTPLLSYFFVLLELSRTIILHLNLTLVSAGRPWIRFRIIWSAAAAISD